MTKIVKHRTNVRAPQDRRRIEEVGQMIKEGLDPLRTTIHGSSSVSRLTYEDLALYYEHHQIPFRYVYCSLEVKRHVA